MRMQSSGVSVPGACDEPRESGTEDDGALRVGTELYGVQLSDQVGDLLQGAFLVNPGQENDDVFGADGAQLTEPLDDLIDGLLCEVHPAEYRLLDVRVVPAHRLAVPADHVVLRLHPVRAHVEDVAGVGVLRHHPQRLLFPAATDEDRWVWPGKGSGRVERPLQAVVLTLEGAVVAGPHLVGELQCLLETLEAFGRARVGHAKPAVLLLVPRRADPEPSAAARQDIQGRHSLDQQPGMAKVTPVTMVPSVMVFVT